MTVALPRSPFCSWVRAGEVLEKVRPTGAPQDLSGMISSWCPLAR